MKCICSSRVIRGQYITFFVGLVSDKRLFFYLCLNNLKIDFMNTVKNFFLGGSGVAGVELASTVQVPTSSDTSELIKIIIQLVIGVATLFGLFKKNAKT